MLDKQEAFRILKKTLNFDPAKARISPNSSTTPSSITTSANPISNAIAGICGVDDYYVKVLTLKEPSAQSFPLIFKRLLEVESQLLRRDGMEKRRFRQDAPDHPGQAPPLSQHQALIHQPSQPQRHASQDVLLDDSKESQVRELGEGIKEIELHGNYFGQFSLTVVIYDLDMAKVDRACADFYKVFSVHDAQLYEEKYNLLNAFLAAVPGNHVFNLRSLYLLNTNYADFSFLFTLHCGEPRNPHLRQEYLAVLETNHHTPYFLNLHYRDVAHTMILGRTGRGK